MSDTIKAAKAAAWDECAREANSHVLLDDGIDEAALRAANPYREVVIDEERLREAIYHAIADRIGPSAEVAPGIIADIIRNYERD